MLKNVKLIFSVIFLDMIFQESFDYIGSSRLVYDMLKEKFSMKLSYISHIIELNQMVSSKDEFWVHTDPTTLTSTSESVG